MKTRDLARPTVERLAADLGVSIDHARHLHRAGVTTREDLRGWTTDDVHDIRGVGPARAAELIAALRGAGIPIPVTRHLTTEERRAFRRAVRLASARNTPQEAQP